MRRLMFICFTDNTYTPEMNDTSRAISYTLRTVNSAMQANTLYAIYMRPFSLRFFRFAFSLSMLPAVLLIFADVTLLMFAIISLAAAPYCCRRHTPC